MTEQLIYFISTLATVITSIASLAYWLGRKLAHLEGRIERLERRVETIARSLTTASVEAHTVVADFFSLKGLITAEEAEFLRKRIMGVFSVYTSYSKANPLTKEELEFILKTFSKPLDEITIEEMDRAYEIGWRLFVEDPEHDPRGFILAIAAAYIRAYLRQKQKKEQRKTTT